MVYVPQFGSDLSETKYVGMNNEFTKKKKERKKAYRLQIDYSISQILGWQTLYF